MDDIKYLEKQEQMSDAYESVCVRCGRCCGAFDGDPCASLVKGPDGKYSCRSYDTRLGLQRTVSGRPFNCVLIRDVLKYDAAHPGCAYRRG